MFFMSLDFTVKISGVWSVISVIKQFSSSILDSFSMRLFVTLKYTTWLDMFSKRGRAALAKIVISAITSIDSCS